MGFQDVALLPSQANAYTTFLRHYCRGESLRTATYPMPVVGVSKYMFNIYIADCIILTEKKYYLRVHFYISAHLLG